MDIVVDAHWGDASDEQVRDYWLSAAHAGYIIAFLAGPLARPGLLPVDELSMTLRDIFDVPLESFALRSSYGDYLASLYGNYTRS